MSSSDRFWAQITKTDTCWLWVGAKAQDGYGKFTCMVNGKPKTWRSHRFAWTSVFGEIAPGLCVCHGCDVPLCVNPNHLFLGTNRENDADRVAKGRQARGDSHGMSKLGADDVLAIRAAYKPKIKGLRQELAERFGVSVACIKDIVARRSWAHI